MSDLFGSDTLARAFGVGGSGLYQAMQSAQPTTQQPEIPDLSAVAAQYPALAPHLANAKVQWGHADSTPAQGLEFYPPWEGKNPNPGIATIELYDRQMQGQALIQAIAGDMMHLIGSVDPRTGQPIDPAWLALKNQLLAQRTPKNDAMDRRIYAQEEPKGGRSYEDWMAQSRGDAYIRGYITPDQEDEWRKNGVYTPEMTATLEKMQKYLQTPPSAAGAK